MIDLNKHVTVIEGVEYVPLDIVKELLNSSIVTQESYTQSQAKFDEAMANIREVVTNISKDINDIIKDD